MADPVGSGRVSRRRGREGGRGGVVAVVCVISTALPRPRVRWQGPVRGQCLRPLCCHGGKARPFTPSPKPCAFPVSNLSFTTKSTKTSRWNSDKIWLIVKSVLLCSECTESQNITHASCESLANKRPRQLTISTKTMVNVNIPQKTSK